MPTNAFDAEVLDLLDRTREVEIETWSPAGQAHRTVIWIVVADGVPYVRSVCGGRGRWYRELRTESHGTLHVGSREIPFQAVTADDPDSVAACSEALRRKYRTARASLAAMLRPETLGTTLRLEPA